MKDITKLKKIIIICALFLLAIIVTFCIVINTKENDPKTIENKLNQPQEIEGIGEPGNESGEEKTENQTVKDLSLYILAKNKINAYINNIYEQNREDVVNVLNLEYRQKEKITNSNVLEKIDSVKTYSEYNILDIKETIINGNYIFTVKGILKAEDDCVYNEETKQWEWIYAKDIAEKELNYIIRFDFAKLTYDIEPVEEIKDKDYDKISIEENDGNTFEYKVFDKNEIIELYLNDFQEKISNNEIDEAYELLDEAYRNQKFKTKEDFEKYIQQSKDSIISAYVTKYKNTTYDNYIEYIFMDKNGKYYIIKEYSAMNYKIALDTYTTNEEEITEKYNNSTNKEKVGMNINKIFSAINTKDYKYVYEKLDESFKNNNLKTQEELEKYLESNLYNQNTVEFEEFEDREGTYIYIIKVKNVEDESQIKDMTVVMQLKEGTDFVMSFSIQ